MVLVSIHVRPCPGYHYPNKIDCIQIDSSERLETIQERYNTTGSTATRLYYRGHELPLNSSVGSHNFDDYAILECCRSPALSAALSACLKDLDEVKKLPLNDRTRDNLVHILQLPASIRHDEDHDVWQARSWSDDGLKSRIINLATMKSVLQRLDRYQIHDLPQCNDCQSLYDALQEHNVWRGGGRDQTKRSFLKSQSHLFKPMKKDGQPTTNWMLLEEKLAIQQRIRREFPGRSAGGDGSPADWLEEFVRSDNARHLNRQGADNRVGESGDGHLAYLAPSPPRRQNTPPRQSRQSPAGSISSQTRSSSRTYTPQYASGPFSVLATLHLALQARHPLSNGRRFLTLTEEQLKRMAQGMCRANLYDKGRIRGRSAFACMDGLMEKQLVRKEIVRNQDSGGEIEKWGLLRDGEDLGLKCADFDRAVNNAIPIRPISEDRSKSDTNLALCLDTREDDLLLERIKRSCNDLAVPFVQKELPAGDYLFLDQHENVSPLVIERKSWSDLADSCHGKGRARNRLDCVKLGSTDLSCSGCQLCKMKRSGCTQVMFIIEGERCLGSDSAHRTAKKCTRDSCCAACKLLSERHGVTQDVLEGVLHRLQIEHGCFIHYTSSYNETIESLMDIRELLQMEQGGCSIPYVTYATNARRSGSNVVTKSPPKSLHVQELSVEATVALVASGEWNVELITDLLGSVSSSSDCSQPNHCSKATEQAAIPNNEDIIELDDDAANPICIDLAGPTHSRKRPPSESHRSGSGLARPNKGHKKNEAICVDSESETETERNKAQNIRGGGNPYDLSSDDEIEVLGDSKVGAASTRADASSSDDDSDDDPFANLSRFDASRRTKLLAGSSAAYDSDSDSEDSLSLGPSARSKKKNTSQRRKSKKKRQVKTPPGELPPAKNQGAAAKSTAASGAAVQKPPPEFCLLSSSEDESLQQQLFPKTPASARAVKDAADDDSSADIMEVSPVRQPTSTSSTRKRKAGTVARRTPSINFGDTLLILHGWREYDQQFHKRVDRIWKDVYSGSDSDIYATSVARLSEVTASTDVAIVRRRSLMRFALWLQLHLGIKVRSVTRSRFAEEIEGMASAPSRQPVQHSRPPTRNLQGEADYSTPIASNAKPSARKDRVPSSQGPSREKSILDDDPVRAARLRRFDPAIRAAPSVDKNKGRSGQWSCPRCTLLNDQLDRSCSACGGDSPRMSTQPSMDAGPPRHSPEPRLLDDIWACPECQWANEGTAFCSACNERRPSAAARRGGQSRGGQHTPITSVTTSNTAAPSVGSNKRRPARCGACGGEGHNRSSATESNCPAFYDPKEVDRREKLRLKREQAIADESEKIKAIEQETGRKERMQAELLRQVEALQRDNERTKDLMQEDLKRRKQKVKRLQKKNNK